MDPIEEARSLAKSASVETFTGGELVKLVTQGWISRVIVGIQAAISASFRTDNVLRPSRVRTKAEVERRFKICVEGFLIMRKDLHWAVPRILDELPIYLRCKLDGADWTPDEVRDAWTGQGKVPILEAFGDDLGEDTPELDGVEIGES